MFYFSGIRIGFLCIDSPVSWNVFIGFLWKSPITCHVFYEEKKTNMLKIPLVLVVCELEFMFTTWKLSKWFLLKYITEKHTFAAINKVLFRQGHQFSSFTEMLSFQCSCSWKCPTGSTLSLKKEPREINKKSRVYILSANFICSFFLNIITVTSVDIVICIECYRKLFWKCLVNKTDKIGSHIDFSKIEISVPIASLEGRVNHAWGVSK